jgi:hypothetical protein
VRPALTRALSPERPRTPAADHLGGPSYLPFSCSKRMTVNTANPSWRVAIIPAIARRTGPMRFLRGFRRKYQRHGAEDSPRS